jgi:hypothetical protein
MGASRCIPIEINPAAARQDDKSGNYPQTPLIIFTVRRDGPAFDHESGSDRKALRQTA